MKADNRHRVALAPRDPPQFSPFTTEVREDRRRDVATKYGVFWVMISRRII